MSESSVGFRRVLLELQFELEGIGEVQWWILSYGSEGEVVSPPELRQRIIEHASKIVRTYKS